MESTMSRLWSANHTSIGENSFFLNKGSSINHLRLERGGGGAAPENFTKYHKWGGGGVV